MSMYQFSVPDSYRKRPIVSEIAEESDEEYEEPLNDELAMVLGFSLEEEDPTIANAIVPDIEFSKDARVVGTQHSSIAPRFSRKPDCVIEDPVDKRIVIMEYKLGSSFDEEDYYEEYRENIESQTQYSTHLILQSDSSRNVPPEKSNQHKRFQDIYENLVEAKSACPGLKSHLIKEFNVRDLDGSKILPTQNQLDELKEFHNTIMSEIEKDVKQKSEFPLYFERNNKIKREKSKLYIAISESADISAPRVNIKPAIPGQTKYTSCQNKDHHYIEVRLRVEKQDNKHNTESSSNLGLNQDFWNRDRNDPHILYYRTFELEGRTNTDLLESFRDQKNKITESICNLLNCIDELE